MISPGHLINKLIATGESITLCRLLWSTRRINCLLTVGLDNLKPRDLRNLSLVVKKLFIIKMPLHLKCLLLQLIIIILGQCAMEIFRKAHREKRNFHLTRHLKIARIIKLHKSAKCKAKNEAISITFLINENFLTNYQLDCGSDSTLAFLLLASDVFSHMHRAPFIGDFFFRKRNNIKSAFSIHIWSEQSRFACCYATKLIN